MTRAARPHKSARRDIEQPQFTPIKIEKPQRITRWSGLDHFKLEKTPMQWSAFKMKIMLHIATTPQYSFLQTLAPLEFAPSAISRKASFEKIIAELIADGLIVGRSTTDPIWTDPIYVATKKGRVFAAAVLSTPLPVQTEPVWVMPKDNERGCYNPGDRVTGYGPSPVQEC